MDCQDFQLLQRYQSLELQTVPKQTFRIQIAAASLHTLPTVHQINTGTSTGEKNHNKTLQHEIILCLILCHKLKEFKGYNEAAKYLGK